MKSTIVMLTLILSTNLFANSSIYAVNNLLVGSTLIPILTSASVSGAYEKAEATVPLNDAQEMLQNGNVSLFSVNPYSNSNKNHNET